MVDAGAPEHRERVSYPLPSPLGAALTRSSLDTPWRRLAAALFDPPRSSRTQVRIDVNAEPVEAYLAATPGARRTLDVLYFVVAAGARALAQDAPALNSFLERGRVRPRETVTVSVTVPLPGDRGLLALPLRGADRPPAAELGASLRAQLLAVRARARRGDLAEYLLARVPWPLRRPLFRLARGLALAGVPMERFDLAPDSFGALIVTNMEPMVRGELLEDEGTFGAALIPQFPAARDATMLSIIPPRELAVVVQGDLVVQRRMTLCFTFDHRLVDGREIGAFVQGLARRLLDPAALDRPAEP